MFEEGIFLASGMTPYELGKQASQGPSSSSSLAERIYSSYSSQTGIDGPLTLLKWQRPNSRKYRTAIGRAKKRVSPGSALRIGPDIKR
jgi:hypothetical protein